MAKLKTFVTQSGFYELAIAAPSMKAATEAWGIRSDAFRRGWAKPTQDTNIVAASMAKPGIVLCRAVGTKGKFTEHPKLPVIKAGKKLSPKKLPSEKTIANKSNKQAKRVKQQQKAEEKIKQQEQKEEKRKERSLKKATAVLERAEKRHEAAIKRLQEEGDRLDQQRQKEERRWDKERARLMDKF